MFPRALPPRSGARSLLLLTCLLGPFAADGQENARPLLATPAPAVSIRPAQPPGLEAYGCATCHAEVSAEWAASAHGLAWVDEQYRKQLADKKRPELCYGCHAPEPLLADVLSPRPDVRDGQRELGVHCESCHVDEGGAMLGPRGTSVTAHPSKVSEHMRAPGSDELCSACHATNIGPVIGIAKDFASAQMAARGLSCVGCHMAPVERSWATDAPVRTGRSHALQTPRDPAFLRLAFGFEQQVVDGKTVVVLKNQAGHRVPGLSGRTLALRFELFDAGGAKLEQQELAFDEKAYLPVDGTREVRFARAGVRVRVTGLHRDPRAAEPIPFLDESLAAN